MAVVIASTVACKKDLHTSSVAQVLPSEVSSKLSRELLAFVEILPADVTGFGYIELGTSLDKLWPLGPDYQGMIADYVEMAQRRWGVDIKKIRGVGVAVQADEPVWFVDLGATANVAAMSHPDVSLVRVGQLTVMGKPSAVSAMVASGQRGAMLLPQRTAWVQHALGRAAGNTAFFSLAADKLAASAGEKERKMIDSAEDLTGVFGKGSLALHATIKPGRMAEARGPVDAGLAMGRAEMMAKLAAMEPNGPEAVAAILARHYGEAMFKGIQVTASGDQLSVSLPWRAPTLPGPAAAPPLAERVVAPDEWAVAQLDLGAPLLQVLVGATDMIGAPLDRAKLTSELLVELSKVGDVPALDPRTVTVSVGGLQALISLHAAKGALPKGTFPIAHGEAMATSTPWGLALATSDMAPTLAEALARPSSGMPLAASSKVAADDQALLRAVVDLDRLPAMMRAMAGQIPVRTVELTATSRGFTANVLAKAGQVAQVQALIDLFKSAMAAESERKYRDRKQASAEDEAVAIAVYHQVQVLSRVVTPKIDGDRLTFSYAFPPLDVPAVQLLGAIGVTAMSAIPEALRDEKQGGESAIAH